MANVNGTLFFQAGDLLTGVELWKSTGTTAGTVLVKDLAPGATFSNPAELTNVNGLLFFTTFVNQTASLWKSDGTSAGTALVKVLISAPTATIPISKERMPTPSGFLSSFDAHLTAVHGTLFFQSQDASTGSELWKVTTSNQVFIPRITR